MKRLLIGLGLMLLTPKAYAISSYLGTTEQDVRITSSSINVPVNLQNSIPAGSNNIGDVDVLTLPALSTGTNTIGNVIIRDAAGQELNINANGSIDVNTTVTPTTNAIRGANGITVTSTSTAFGEALHTYDRNGPDLGGKSMVYASSNTMVVGSTLTVTGLGKSVDLLAIGGDCTFKVNNGDLIIVNKNTSESFDYEYTLTNPQVFLNAKDAASTCRSRIVAAN